MAWVHKLTEKNTETMTGVCVTCGPVALRWRNTRQGKRVCCATARQADRKMSNEYRRLPHGLTSREARAFKEGKACELCGATEDLAVDYCHTRGKIRGVLCQPCNKGLGFFRDNPELMERAAEYVRRHSPQE